MREIVIDCANVTSADGFWQLYLEAANPTSADKFGRNLDAFWDAVERGGPGWPGEVRLVFINCASLADLPVRGGASSLRDALQAIAAEVTTIRLVVED